MSSMKKLILASTSPRRKKLLEQIGLQFEAVPSKTEEKMNPRLKPRSQAEFLSQQKAQEVTPKYKNALILAADTLVVFEDQIIGKPQSPDDAKRMLRKLSGKPHLVITGYTIIDTEKNKSVTESVATTVYMKKMSEKDIHAYVKSGEPLDKAGGYGLQEKGGIFVKKVDGDPSNVVGLPLPSLVESLKKFGVHVL